MAKGQKTGGRQKGTPNKVTAEARELAKSIFEGLREDAERWLKQAAEEDPAKGYALWLETAHLFLPKLVEQKSELTGGQGGPLVVKIIQCPVEE